MRFASTLFPAVLATLVLALLPSCAVYRFAEPASGPIERPHIVERVALRDAEAPRILRGAGEWVWYGGGSWGYNVDDASDRWTAVYLLGGILVAVIAWIVFELIALAIDVALEDVESEDNKSLVEKSKRAGAQAP